MKTYIQCWIEVVAPIHIGCDEVYEPTAFVVDEHNGRLVIFDPAAFLSALDQHRITKFSEICRKGTVASILEVYKFLRGWKINGRQVEVCKGFLDHYERTLNLSHRDEWNIKKELNNFTVARTAFLNEDNRPYISGSSIKGAIRTAYLNGLARTRGIETPRGGRPHKELERLLLDMPDAWSLHTDPFRMLKVSDFLPVGEVRTRIVYAVNEKKKPSQFGARGPYQILEVIEPGARFVGCLTLDHPERKSGIRTPITLETLTDSIRSFYSTEKQREDRELAVIGVPGIRTESEPSMGLLRLGRHSGAECVTIAGHRRISIMRSGRETPRQLDAPTTLWLAAESAKPTDKKRLRPFGWSALLQLDSEQKKVFADSESEWMSTRGEQRKEATLVFSAAEISPPVERKETPVDQKEQNREVWHKAILVWNPGTSVVTAIWEDKKASVAGKDLVPEPLHGKLFKKKKRVEARVVVEVLGPEYFRIVEITRNGG